MIFEALPCQPVVQLDQDISVRQLLADEWHAYILFSSINTKQIEYNKNTWIGPVYITV